VKHDTPFAFRVRLPRAYGLDFRGIDPGNADKYIYRRTLLMTARERARIVGEGGSSSSTHSSSRSSTNLLEYVLIDTRPGARTLSTTTTTRHGTNECPLIIYVYNLLNVLLSSSGPFRCNWFSFSRSDDGTTNRKLHTVRSRIFLSAFSVSVVLTILPFP